MNLVGRLKKRAGFTIVELLIVIVIIGILAAITIVAYNGIQQRAKNSQIINTASAWAKASILLQQDTGALPAGRFCLGEDTQTGFTGSEAGQPHCLGGTGEGNPTSNSASQMTALKQYMNSAVPTADTTTVGTAATWQRGMYFNNWSGYGGKHIVFILFGSQTCPAIAGTYVANTTPNVYGTQNTRCIVAFNVQ